MTDIINLLRGFVRIKAEGYNQIKLLTELTENGIAVKEITKESPKVMFFNVIDKESQKTFAILEKLCYNYSVEKSYGIKQLFSNLLKRIGLIMGALIFSAFSIFGSLFVWRVEINGNEKIDSLVIERALKDNGISPGSKRTSIDAFRTRMILNDIDGIAESSVELIGSTLKITVFEDTEYTDPEAPKATSLLSAYDAEITRIIVEEGTAKVNIGDNIALGSELISGEIFDTNGNSLGLKEAKGQVFGIVNFSVGIIFPDKTLVERETGNRRVCTELNIFGIKIGGEKNIGFERYRKETTQGLITKNLFIPVKYTKSVYYETRLEEVENDIEVLTTNWQKEKILELIINCGGSEVDAFTVSNKLAGNLTKVDLFLRAEMPLIKY